MKTIFLMVSILSVPIFSTHAEEPQKPADEFEKTEVLDKPRYSLTNRFAFDLGLNFMPLDAFYKPILLEGAVSYQFSDWISWEIVRAGYSLHNVNTGLTGAVERQMTVAAGTPQTLSTNQELKKMRYRVGSMVYFNLLYSKSNWFNKSIVYHYWQVGGGPMFYDMKKHHQMGAELALRVRFFINNTWLLDLRGGHTIGFRKGPKQITSLGAGAGFAF